MSFVGFKDSLEVPVLFTVKQLAMDPKACACPPLEPGDAWFRGLGA